VNRVVRGLLASPDAHYLITGYPGVGKTSFVSRVIVGWRQLCLQRGISRALIFNLQLAKSESPEQVVKRLIGKVYFGSLDGQYSPEKQLAERLQLSFVQAHSKTLKETQDETAKKEKGGEANVDFAKLGTIFGAGFKIGRKRSKESHRSIEVEREYNLSAAIGDFEAVVHLLTKPEFLKLGRHWPFWPFKTYETQTREQRILFVFDQIEDIESLEALSPLFDLPRSSFIVLGGVKLKEQVASAKEKGLQVLDSFQEEYLQCQWNEAEKILSLLVSQDQMSARHFAEYRDYLNFSAQGLPRRLFAAIDRHTTLIDDSFYLRLTEADLLRARLASRLHRVIWKNRKRILGDYIDSVQYFLRDRALRGTYHLADRIFRTAQFTFNDADTVVTQMSDAIVHSERKKVLRNLLSTFVDEGLIVNDGNNYRLADSVLKWVQRIPDWLKDGFVDARTFLADFTRVEYPSESTGVVRVKPPAWREEPKQSITPEPFRHTPISELVATHLERYTILRLLGRGGMGEVYLAEDKALKRRVALKVIHADVGRSPEARARFLREGQVVAHLQDPSIVQIYDLQELPTGQIVLVTEFVDGIGLDTLLRDGEILTLHKSLSIAIQTARALRQAHSQGVIHRDIKPSNILVNAQGHVKLLDFGIAKLAEEPELDTVTRTGEIVGTPAYMSPEQIMGTSIDARADLYSFGVVMYQMLAGRRHFEDAGTTFELAMKITKEKPRPPSVFNPKVPNSLDNVVMKCLETKPENRFSSATELITALMTIEESLRAGPKTT